MDFDWTATETEFRAEVRAFLVETLPQGWSGHDERDVQNFRSAAKQFCQALASRGWFTEHWPTEFGGSDASPWRYLVLNEELWPIGEPRGSQYMNANWIGPAIMQFGTEAQKQYHLRRISSGDVFWCQGFSEPDAGSDLAALRCRAVRENDDYVITGTKLWTSWAHEADYCFLLVRTGPEPRGYRGITVLLVPMDTPGITVRGIGSFVGEHAFAEVVFDEVRVSADCRLGDENEGWGVVRHALSFERVGAPHYQLGLRMLDAVVADAKRNGSYDDPLILARIGSVLTAMHAARLLFYRVVDLRAHGSPPSADANVARVAMTEALHALGSLMSEVYGLDGLEKSSAGDVRKVLRYSVASGPTEVQLDLVATRFLSLPKKPAVVK